MTCRCKCESDHGKRIHILVLVVICFGRPVAASDPVFKIDGEAKKVAGPIRVLHVWDNHVWVAFGTSDTKGLYRWKIDGSAKPVQVLSDIKVHCIYEEGKNLFVGTNAGLQRLTSWDHAKAPPTHEVKGGPVICAVPTDTGLWLGGLGLFFLDKKQKELPAPRPETSGKLVYAVVKHGNTISAGTQSDIKNFDAKTGALQDRLIKKNTKLIGTDFNALHWQEEKLWFSAKHLEKDPAGGLLQTDQLLTEPNLIPGVGSVNAIAESDGMLWLASEKGLLQIPTSGASENTDAVPDSVTALHRHGDKLWYAAKNQVFTLEGMNGGAWDPGIEAGWLWFIDRTFHLRWSMKNDKNRCSPKWIHFRGVMEATDLRFERVRVKDKPEEFEQRLENLPVGVHTFEIQAIDLHGIPSAMGRTHIIVFPKTWVAAVAIIAAFCFVGALVVSTEFYHRVIGLVGFRWIFSEANANVSLFIRSDGLGTAIVHVATEAAARPTVHVPPMIEDFLDLLTSWRKQAESNAPYLAKAYIEAELFKYNWTTCLSDQWTDADGKVFAGAIIGLGTGEKLPDFPPRHGKMVVTGIGCAYRATDPLLAKQDLLVRRAVAAFAGSGFIRVAKPTLASKKDLIEALTTSDVCIIAGHARNGCFRFPDCEFGASDWAALGEEMRCRFLIIAGCGLGDLTASADPLLLGVVRRGVTCLACMNQRQDTVVAEKLLVAFCQEWSSGRTSGLSIAAALSSAGRQTLQQSLASDVGLVEQQVNSYVIVGNPTLRLEFRWTSQGVRK